MDQLMWCSEDGCVLDAPHVGECSVPAPADVIFGSAAVRLGEQLRALVAGGQR